MYLGNMIVVLLIGKLTNSTSLLLISSSALASWTIK